MLGDFITRSFVLVFGYAYPAFKCYKTLEKNKVNIEELRFWCQYWIIAASITVFERFGDIFVSWIPMYGEAKLALFVYLWFPKTKGCGYVYESIVRPYISKHETDIDRTLKEFRARGMDLVIYYWQNFAKLGQDKFFEPLQYFASQSANLAISKTENAENEVDASATSCPRPPNSPPTTPTSVVKMSIRMLSEKNRQMSDNSRQLSAKKLGRPPMPPSSPTATAATTPTATAATAPTLRRIVARSASARTFPEKGTTSFSEDKGQTLNDMVDQNGVDHDLQSSPTLKLLRRSKTSLQQHQ